MIKLSQTGSDALKALGYIACNGSTVQIKDIVASQGMSETCLRRIIPNLAKAGIIISKQGRGGGVMLAKAPSCITLYDIFIAVGEEVGITDCTRGESCDNQSDCYTTDVLTNLQRGFNLLLKLQTLDKITQ